MIMVPSVLVSQQQLAEMLERVGFDPAKVKISLAHRDNGAMVTRRLCQEKPVVRSNPLLRLVDQQHDPVGTGGHDILPAVMIEVSHRDRSR